MKNIRFYKFHGAGNDFILIDNRDNLYELTKEEIAFCCHRRYGIGADGLIIMEQTDKADFAMRYYNADGCEATLCGNGSRCITALASMLHVIDRQCTFIASDGEHNATVNHQTEKEWNITVDIKDIKKVKNFDDGHFLDTGSPHFVVSVNDLANYDVENEGNRLRHDKRFKGGTNVDFVMPTDNGIYVRTYERGVEAETLSCGTGVTASALAWAHLNHWENGHYEVPVTTPGGNFIISFDKKKDHFKDILLTGPAKWSYTGEIRL